MQQKIIKYIKTKLNNSYHNISAKSWYPIGIYLRMKYYSHEVDNRLMKTKLFFILSTGRSGTKFLSNFLNENKDIVVLHEPDFIFDVEVLPKCIDSLEYSLRYLDCFKKHAIYDRIIKNNVSCYGEVTGTLRYQAEALKKVFPHTKILLLARDGRDVVRSTLKWKFYKKGSIGAYNIKPSIDDRYHDNWNSMTRFEKICWSWMHSNEYLLEHVSKQNIIIFEKLINNFNYFREKISDPLGLSINNELWHERKGQKSSNASKEYVFPHWSEWDSYHKETFRNICGSTMNKLGYII